MGNIVQAGRTADRSLAGTSEAARVIVGGLTFAVMAVGVRVHDQDLSGARIEPSSVGSSTVPQMIAVLQFSATHSGSVTVTEFNGQTLIVVYFQDLDQQTNTGLRISMVSAPSRCCASSPWPASLPRRPPDINGRARTFAIKQLSSAPIEGAR
jgi:hypothetical protein